MFPRSAPAALSASKPGAPPPAGAAAQDAAGGAAPGPVLLRDASGEAAAGLERTLVRRARQGDAAAFEQLVAPLLPPAFQLAVRLVGDRQLAEDVAQEALLKAFTAIRQFRGESRFATWVFRIVHNASTDALRYRGRRPQRSLSAPGDAPEAPERDVPDSAPGPEEVVLERQGRAGLLAAVAALSPDYRAVVLLRDVQGLSYEEVAAITGQNLGTVKSRLHRARAALRAALEAAPTPRPPG